MLSLPLFRPDVYNSFTHTPMYQCTTPHINARSPPPPRIRPHGTGWNGVGMASTHGVAAAEIKHGRVSMLAVVGFLLTQYVHLPGDQFAAGPLEALTTVPLGAQGQVFTCECSSQSVSLNYAHQLLL